MYLKKRGKKRTRHLLGETDSALSHREPPKPRRADAEPLALFAVRRLRGREGKALRGRGRLQPVLGAAGRATCNPRGRGLEEAARVRHQCQRLLGRGLHHCEALPVAPRIIPPRLHTLALTPPKKSNK